jgi:HD-GYP domain-containing protein (c-di-GMP phosphodiesterase class II)
MRERDIRTLHELCDAVESDPRLGSYQITERSDRAVELRLGVASVMVLEAARFAERSALEPYLLRSREKPMRVVLLGNQDELAAVAMHADPNEASLEVLPMAPAHLAVLLPRELDLITLRDKLRERGRLAERYRYELSELLSISRAISSERDVVALLGVILEKSRYIAGADAGSIYIVEGNDLGTHRRTLRFMVSQNESMPVDFREFTLPVDDRSIVGKTVLGRAAINIPDLYRLDEPGWNPWGVHHNRALDEKSGYRTHSMLTFPLINQHDEVAGVIQLINRKRDPHARLRDPDDFAEQVIPFDKRSEELCETLAAQAGISLENALLTEEIQQLFEGFVNASVTAIESRDPTTSGHSQRVATLTCRLAEIVDGVDAGPLAGHRFTADDIKQIEYAGLLHDFGKVGVREKILVKARKLYEHERDQLLQRFDYVRKAVEADCLRRRLEGVVRSRSLPPQPHALFELDDEARGKLAELDEIVEFLLGANEPTVQSTGSFERLDEIARLSYVDARGQRQPYLTASEIESLKVTRGSLTGQERKEIESHVLHTFNFLATIPWGRKFGRIPLIAGTHHEKLDGSGYPWGLDAPDIPVEARMMAISDIFDALTASDRPYKRAVPVERALSILEEEVQGGKCDHDLFRVFVEAKVWESVLHR